MLMVFPVIIQSSGSFLCSFLLSPLSSLSMKMLPSSMPLCIRVSFEFRLPLFFRFGVQTGLPTISGFFSVAFLCDVLFGTYKSKPVYIWNSRKRIWDQGKIFNRQNPNRERRTYVVEMQLAKKNVYFRWERDHG